MSVNENQEFEAINQKVKERTVNVDEVRQSVADTYKAVKIRRKTKAITIMAVTLLALVIVLRGINGLETIGWINGTFKAVLMSATGCVAMFTQGYFWHELKN